MTEQERGQSYSLVEGVLVNIADWVNRCRDAIGVRDEFDRCTPDEVMHVAADLGVTPAELRKMTSKGPAAADQLQMMLKALGLDPQALAKSDFTVMRDLQRVCIMCGDKKGCEQEFADGTAAANFREFCPNAVTLEALVNLEGRPKTALTDVTNALAACRAACHVDQDNPKDSD